MKTLADRKVLGQRRQGRPNNAAHGYAVLDMDREHTGRVWAVCYPARLTQSSPREGRLPPQAHDRRSPRGLRTGDRREARRAAGPPYLPKCAVLQSRTPAARHAQAEQRAQASGYGCEWRSRGALAWASPMLAGGGRAQRQANSRRLLRHHRRSCRGHSRQTARAVLSQRPRPAARTSRRVTLGTPEERRRPPRN
jgi:hypothetical protein